MLPHFDAKDAADAHSLAAYLHYSQEIRDTLTKQIRNTTKLCLPLRESRRFRHRLPANRGRSNRSSVIRCAPCCADDRAAKSDCPHVAALREAIAADYIRMNADRIAEAAS